MILVLFLYFLYALTFIFAKSVVEYVQPIFFVAVRMIIGGGILLAYQLLYLRTPIRIRKQDAFYFAQIMLLGICLSYAGEFWSIQYITAAKTSLLFNISPFITAGIAHFMIHERLTLRQWIGLILGFGGLLPILFTQQADELSLAHIGFLSSAEIILLLAVAAAAYSWVIFKRLVVDRGYTPLTINGVTMLGGGILAYGLSLCTETTPYIHIIPDQSYLHTFTIIAGYMGALILSVNIFSYNLYGHLLRRYTATFISFAGFVTPLFTAVLDWIFLGERVGGAFFISMLIVLSGLILFYIDER